MKIKKDNEGLYLNLGGFFGRPKDGKTIFKEGDDVEATHIDGTAIEVAFKQKFKFSDFLKIKERPLEFEHWPVDHFSGGVGY